MKKITLFGMLMILLSLAVFSQDVLFQEDFNNNSAGWYEFSDNEASASIKRGHFVLQQKRKSGGWHFRLEQYIDDEKDFYIETRMKQMAGVDDNGYGLIWGTKDWDNNFHFVISTNGYAIIYGYKNDEYFEYSDWIDLNNINKFMKYNKLGIKKTGNTIYFYVNDVMVQEHTFEPFFGDYIGFVLNDNMVVEADYLTIKGAKSAAPEINVAEGVVQGYEKENLGSNVNSSVDEVTPVISPDGSQLYVCRKKHAGNVGSERKDDIWVADRNMDGTWGKMRNVGFPLNNDGYNSVVAVSPDGNTLLLSNTYMSDGSVKGSGVSISHRKVGGWSVPTDIEIDNYYNNNDYVNYCMSPDRKVLIMAIEREDSFGDQDLYVSFLKADGSWTEPKHMGGKINTPDADFAPFMAADGITLYYATYGKLGYGSADIFLTRRLDDTWLNWSEPENAGPEINSEGWEAYYTVPASGDYAYMVSDENTIGGTDIFRIKLAEAVKPKPVVLVYGKVLNKKTNEPISADIRYNDLTTNQEKGLASSNPDDGSYKIVLTSGSAYSFLADKDGYYAISENIDLTNVLEYKEIEKNLYLAPIEVGETIRLNNIFFDYNSSVLKPESYAELDRLIKIMKDNPNMKIEIGGHTDSQGSDSYNMKLSEDRAKSVGYYLLGKDIFSSRAVSKGYGETRPVATNDTEDGRAMNRRVEFTILEK